MKDYTDNTLIFSESLKITETSDPAHANVINAAPIQVFQNTLYLRKLLAAHTDSDNPHNMTKASVGLGHTDDTPDMKKPVSEAQQAALDSYYQQTTGYTDQKIADLINGAPSTLDTLGEIAKAMQDNGDVVAALNESIGSRASESEFDSHRKAVDGLLGNTDISAVGDGTVTGAIAALNTAMGGWTLYPDPLTQAQYDVLPDDVKSTPKLIFIIPKE